MNYLNIPQLKLKYNIKQTSHLEPKAVIILLVSKLKGKEYEILEQSDDNLIFYNNPWALRWNFQRAILLDGGSVRIENSNNSSVISFSYYLDMLPLALLPFLLIISTVIDREYEAALFFGCFYIVLSIISIIRAKLEAKKILREILNNDDTNQTDYPE